MHCANALKHVFDKLTKEQSQQAKEAAKNLIDRAEREWPKAGYNQPSEPAATPEEIAENKRFYESQRA
jgi:hypothetical protein